MWECKNIVMWAMTYRCNMACEYCYVRELVKNYDELDDAACLAVAHKIANDPTFRPDAVWLTGGEPTLRACLADVVSILRAKGIATVINTNGFASREVYAALCESAPTGITVSIESDIGGINDSIRGHTASVLETLGFLAKAKKTDTVLGVSCVIGNYPPEQLLPFARRLKALGVEYLSLNPLIGGDAKFDADYYRALYGVLDALEGEMGFRIPNRAYFDFIRDFHAGHAQPLPCPATEKYLFLAPWGQILPCSNECWQSVDPALDAVLEVPDLAAAMQAVRARHLGGTCCSTASPCFGERCIGCWKVYHDDIFT